MGLLNSLGYHYNYFHARTFSDLIITFNSFYFENLFFHRFEVIAIIITTLFSTCFLLIQTSNQINYCLGEPQIDIFMFMFS